VWRVRNSAGASSLGSCAGASSSVHLAQPAAAPVALPELSEDTAAHSGGDRKGSLSVLRGILTENLAGGPLSMLYFDS
jgi:hypothetical protein